MIRRDACRGCRDDFYNGRTNLDGGTRCWSAKDGRMVTRYRIEWWTQPSTPFAYHQVRVPSCYHQPGKYAFHDKLPSFVKLSDVVRASKRRAA